MGANQGAPECRRSACIDDSNLLGWFLDPDIQFPNPSAVTNLEPLLVNTAGSLQYRPEAKTEIPNFSWRRIM